MENEKNSFEQETIAPNDQEESFVTNAEDENVESIDINEINEVEKEEPKFNWMKEIREWVVAILLAVIITFGIKYYVFDIVQVDGTSMLPTVVDSDRIVLLKLGYTPKPFDVIVLTTPKDPGRPYIKRVIATAGQVVDIKGGNVFVDGSILDEEYLADGILTSAGNYLSFPLTVPEGDVFVLGDNRVVSKDSRAIGVVPIKDVIGRATFRFWPLSSIGDIK